MRWMLLLFMSLSLPALADLDYSLKPRQIAEDTWLLEGSTDNFAKANGGNIVNTAFIVTEPGVVVIDTGPSKRYGEAMRKAIAAITDKPVIQVLLTHHHPDHVLGNQAFTDVPIGPKVLRAYWSSDPAEGEETGTSLKSPVTPIEIRRGGQTAWELVLPWGGL